MECHCPASLDGAELLCGVSPDTCESLEGGTVIAPFLIERSLGPEGSCLLHVSCGVRTTSGEDFLRLRSVSPATSSAALELQPRVEVSLRAFQSARV